MEQVLGSVTGLVAAAESIAGRAGRLPGGQPPYGQPPYGQPPYGQPPYGLRRGSVQDPERRSGSVGRATDRPISESTVAVKVLVIEPTSNTLEASIPAP
jgi:hypothetical protein